MTSGLSQKPSSRLPSLDGWRAFSIMLVLGSHSIAIGGKLTPTGRPAELAASLFDGNLGVRFFFVISGFLITWLLANEHLKYGQINLIDFYTRRCFRILPVYISYLACLLTLQLLGLFRLKMLVWLSCLTFTVDFFPADPQSTGLLVLHLWSLSVEEQFYLIWPTIFFVCSRWGLLNKKTFIVLSIPLIMGSACRILGNIYWIKRGLIYPFIHSVVDHLLNGNSILKYCDSLSIGCVCALMMLKYYTPIQSFLAKWFTETIAINIILIEFPQITNLLISHDIIKDCFGHFIQTAGFFADLAFGDTLQAVGFAVLMMQSIVLPTKGPYFLLNHPVVSWVGRLSYSVYIWQQLFWINPKMYGLGEVWWMSFPGWLLPVIAVASISYYGIEMPFLRLRNLFRPGSRRVQNHDRGFERESTLLSDHRTAKEHVK